MEHEELMLLRELREIATDDPALVRRIADALERNAGTLEVSIESHIDFPDWDFDPEEAWDALNKFKRAVYKGVREASESIAQLFHQAADNAQRVGVR